MTHSLHSAKLKAKRATELYEELQNAINNYYEESYPDLLRAPNPENDSEHVLLAKTPAAIPENIPLVAGDVIHNMRSALDHAIYEIAGGDGKNMRNIYFPFGKSLDSFKNNLNNLNKKSSNLSDNVKSFLLELKPYKGGNDVLYTLHELDIMDKHRMLVIVDVISNQFHGQFSCDHPIKISTELLGSLHQGIHIFTIPANATFEQNIQLSYALSFGEIHSIKHQPMIDVLQQQLETTRDIIKEIERLH